MHHITWRSAALYTAVFCVGIAAVLLTYRLLWDGTASQTAFIPDCVVMGVGLTSSANHSTMHVYASPHADFSDPDNVLVSADAMYNRFATAMPFDPVSGRAALPVTGKLPDSIWYRVNYRGQVGWVYADDVVLEGNCAAVPVITR